MDDSPAPKSTTPAPVVGPRRRTWAKRTSAALAAVLLCCCGAWFLVEFDRARREGSRELAAVREELDRTDPDWAWEALNAARKEPPEGTNGADLIPRIKARTHPDWGRTFLKEEFVDRLDVPPNVRFPPDVLAQARRDIELSAEAVRLARSLKDRPAGHRNIELAPNVFGTLLADTQHTRHTADVLRWDAIVAAEDGDARRAADALRALLNASRSVGDEPFIISQLVRIAVRAVAVGYAERALAQCPDVPLTELQAAYAADAEEPLLLYCLRGERAANDRLFENIQSGAISLEDALGPRPENRWGWRDRTNLSVDRATALRLATDCIAAARRPIHEQPRAFAAIPEPPADKKLVVSDAMWASAERLAQAYWRSVAEARCAVAGIACERFRQQHQRWPDTLAELVPAFLPAVPLDPYNGAPLRFVKLEAGVVVFSVGQDGRGEGGTLGSLPSAQTRFRLWNPDRRRLPPPPDPPPPEPERP